MPKLIVVKQTGDEIEIEGQADHSVMDLIHNSGGIDELPALCGGFCACATCHVWVDPAFIDKLPEAADNEIDLLNGSQHRSETSRLSCQVMLTDDLDGLRVTLTPGD